MRYTRPSFKAAALALCTLFASQTYAITLLTIDVSNPSAVVVTSTNASPLISVTGTDNTNGVSFLNFFTSNATSANIGAVSSSLFGGTSTNNFDLQFLDGTFVNIFGSSAPTDYLLGAPAFTGTATFNLSQNSSVLPQLLGATGDIAIGFQSPFNSVIGQYEIIGVAPIPLPAAAWLFISGLAGLFGFRRYNAV